MRICKKIISFSFIIALPMMFLACGNSSKENPFKAYFPNDKNLVVESTLSFPNDKKSETITYTTSILNSNDTRIQYVVKSSTITTYVYEFRDNNVYVYSDPTIYDSMAKIPDLVNNLQSDSIKQLYLKGPLEVGTTWTNDSGELTYKIENIDDKAFTFSTVETANPEAMSCILVFTKDIGLFSNTTTVEGKNISVLENKPL